jgi:hypothetical protein
MVSRRWILATAPALVLPTPGCLSRSTEPDQVYVDDIVVLNDDSEPHTVTVRVTDDSDAVFAESFDVAAGSSVNGIDIPAEFGAYVVSASLDDGKSYSHNLGAHRDGDQVCVYVVWRVTQGGSLAADIHTGTDCDAND